MKLSILSDTARERRRRAIGRAIASLREGMNQTELGYKLDAPQTTVSRWERGTVDLTLEQALAIETHLGLPLGTLAKAGGYIAPDDKSTAKTTEEMLRTDPNLDPDIRDQLISWYKHCVSMSNRIRRIEGTTTMSLPQGRRAS